MRIKLIGDQLSRGYLARRGSRLKRADDFSSSRATRKRSLRKSSGSDSNNRVVERETHARCFRKSEKREPGSIFRGNLNVGRIFHGCQLNYFRSESVVFRTTGRISVPSLQTWLKNFLFLQKYDYLVSDRNFPDYSMYNQKKISKGSS